MIFVAALRNFLRLHVAVGTRAILLVRALVIWFEHVLVLQRHDCLPAASATSMMEACSKAAAKLCSIGVFPAALLRETA